MKKRLGRKRGRPRVSEMIPGYWAQLRRLAEKGLAAKEIAAGFKVKVSVNTVRADLKVLNGKGGKRGKKSGAKKRRNG